MPNTKESISYRLLINVILIYFIVTVIVTAIHLFIDFDYQKKHINEELQTIAMATNKSIQNAVWDINTKQLQSVAQGILELPAVKAIKIIDKNGQLLFASKECKECLLSPYKYSSSLNKTIFDKAIYLGELRLYSHMDIIIDRMKENFAFLLFGSLLKSALLVILFILAFKKFLKRPLDTITNQINAIDLNQKEHKSIQYNNPNNNELTILKDSVNGMLEKIDEQFARLQESEQELQQKVQERTQDLKSANNQLSSVIQGSNLGYWDWNLQTKEFEVNERWLNIIGLNFSQFDRSEFNWQTLMFPSDKQTILPLIDKAIRHDQTFTIEYRMKHKDGHYVWVEIAGSLIERDKKGRPLRACGTHKDISTRKRNEKELIQQKNFLNTLVKNAPNPIFYKDRDGKYLGVNDAWVEMVGFTDEEIINKSVFDVAPVDIARLYAAQDEKVFNLSENPQIYKSVVVNKNTKESFDVMFYKSAYFDENNEVAGLIGSMLDLTEINKLQEEKIRQEKILFEQSKLASMGEMIGNIAHQWRQPLSVISTYATGIELHNKLNMLTDELLKESCEKINENAQYLSTTIDDFKSFIKGDESVIDFEIKEVLDSFKSLINPIIKQHQIKLYIDLHKNMRAYGYPNQLIQCFMNLFNNAKDAYLSDQTKLFFITQSCEDNELIIEFKDNAGGINKEIFDKIFEPYFTTKHQSQGTGLGLHMSYKLITEGMHGSITVENVNYEYEGIGYKGALFTIRLPLEYQNSIS